MTPEQAVKLAMAIRREARSQGVTLSELERLQLMADATKIMSTDVLAKAIKEK
jgi:hypothetical protein